MMRTPDITTVSELKKYVEKMECNRFNFLDEDGEFASKSRKPPITFECIFIDGTVAQVPMTCWKEFENLEFRLRTNPEDDH